MKFAGLMDIPCTICDKHGYEEFTLVMKDANHLKSSNFNLFSTTKLLSQGWELSGDAESMEVTNGTTTLHFDIKV